jgi:hypothetical protein
LAWTGNASSRGISPRRSCPRGGLTIRMGRVGERSWRMRSWPPGFWDGE